MTSADPRPAAAPGRQVALRLELGVRLGDGAAGKAEVRGERARGGQARSGAQPAVANRGPQRGLDGVPATAAGVERELQRRAPKSAREVYRAIDALDESVVLDEPLRELVRLRASQLNGCAWCVDQHSRDARAAGEDECRLWSLSVWRETPFFDARERAALALTEAVTLLPVNGVPDDVYEDAAREFPPDELGNLIGAIIAINAWNRVGVTTGMQPPAELATAVA